MDGPALGAHLETPRRGYIHHGIYVGNGKVVHYAGLSAWLKRGPIEETTLEAFTAGRGFKVTLNIDPVFSPADIVRRARSRVGEDSYRILSNNCEHFCEWCVSGRSVSRQVEKLLGWLPARRARAIFASPASRLRCSH